MSINMDSVQAYINEIRQNGLKFVKPKKMLSIAFSEFRLALPPTHQYPKV